MIYSKDKSRREFIKTCLRFGIGGGLILAGVVLGTRKKTADTESDQCYLSSPCRGCSQYYGCNLPKALAVKEGNSQKGGSRGRK
jgi:hypothetical protein